MWIGKKQLSAEGNSGPSLASLISWSGGEATFCHHYCIRLKKYWVVHPTWHNRPVLTWNLFCQWNVKKIAILTIIHLLKRLSSPRMGNVYTKKSVRRVFILKLTIQIGSHSNNVSLNQLFKSCCTNLLFSPPGLRGRASISIGPQAEAATGLTTGMADHAPLVEETWREKKQSMYVCMTKWMAWS